MKNKNKVVTLILLFFLVLSLQVGCASSIPTPTDTKSRLINMGEKKNVELADNDKDDTQAVQSAIDEAVAGDIVYFPNGTYNISNLNIWKNGIKLEGKSEKGAVFKFIGDTYSECLVRINDVSEVTLTKITITAGNNNKLLDGIIAEKSTKLLISHVTIKDFVLDTKSEDDNFGPHGIYFTGDDNFTNGVTDSEISNCTISNIGTNSQWGAGIRIARGSNRNKVMNNTLSDFGRGGIHANDKSNYLIITNNKVTGTGLYDIPKEPGDHNGEALGIEVFGECYAAVIEDNTVDHWISVAAESNYCAVRRNTVMDKELDQHAWCQLELAESTNGVFTDNFAGIGAQTGISMSNGENGDPIEYAYFGYNTVKDSVLFGVNMDGTGKSIRNIYFYKNSITDTKLDNIFSESRGYEGVGVYFKGTDNITFDTCKIDKNERSGVRLMARLNDKDHMIGTDNDHISFINSTISNSTNAFTFFNKSPISKYTDYTSFEFTNSTATKNTINDIPQIKNDGNAAPTALIDAPLTGLVGQKLSFNSASTDSDGEIKHVLWDFGAGAPLSNPNSVFAYNKKGKYRVTLIVWDNEGKAARAETTITIKDGSNANVEGNDLVLTAVPTPEPPPPPDPNNLAKGKPVTGSKEIESGCTPEMAVNGSPEYPEYSPMVKGDMWLSVDLGEEMTISRYVVYHISSAGDPTTMNTKEFSIQISNDGKTWTEVSHVLNDSAEPISDVNVLPFVARYVKYVIIQCGQDATVNQGRVLEFELYKNPKAAEKTMR